MFRCEKISFKIQHFVGMAVIGITSIAPVSAQVDVADKASNATAAAEKLNARLELKRAAQALIGKEQFGSELTPTQEADLVNRNREALEITRHALTLEFTPVPISEMQPVGDFAAFGEYRALARLLATQSRVQLRAGDVTGAVVSGLDTLRLSHKIQRDGILLVALVGQATEAIGRRALRETMPQLDAATAKSLARQLHDLEQTRWSWAQTVTSEGKAGKLLMQQSLAESLDNDQKRQAANERYQQLIEWQIAQAETPYQLSEQRSNGVEDFLAALAAEEEEEDENHENNAEDNAFAARVQAGEVGLLVEKLFVPSRRLFTHTRFSFERNRAANWLFTTELALRAFELENKRAANSLDELVPVYLSRVPFDPFGVEETLQWKEREGKRVLYSIGPDGLDDGGLVVPNKPTEKRPTIQARSRGDIIIGVNAR